MKNNKFNVIMTDDNMTIEINRKYLELIKENDNSLVGVEKDKNVVLNVNDIFDNIQESNSIYVHIGLFSTIFNYCMNSNLSIKDSVNFILNSNLCLSKKIPPYTIEYLNDNSINIKNLELPSSDELCNIIDEMKKTSTKIRTNYECENNLDIISACIHYFVSRGHKLKVCKHCKKWFLTDNRNDQEYCKRNSPLYPKMDCNRAQKYIRKRIFDDEINTRIKSLKQQFYNNGYNAKDKSFQDFNQNIDKWATKIMNKETTKDEFKVYLKNYRIKGGSK